MNPSVARWSLVALVLTGALLSWTTPAEGQLGGLARRAKQQVKEAVSGSASPAPATTPAAAAASGGAATRSPYNEWVLEMTPAVLDRLERGLAAEEAAREGVARKAAAVKSREAYFACAGEAVMSAEGQRLQNDSNEKTSAFIADPTNQGKQASYQKAQQAVVDHMRETCGVSPDEFESTELPALREGVEVAGREAAGLETAQYAILKERVAPLCGVAEAVEGGAVRLPGEGNDIFWVYSAAEVEALLPRCPSLSARIEPADR